MADIREQLDEFREWVEKQSGTVWSGVLVGGVVLFAVAQRLAQVSATTVRTTPTVILASLVATVLFVISMAALGIAAWALVMELRARDVEWL